MYPPSSSDDGPYLRGDCSITAPVLPTRPHTSSTYRPTGRHTAPLTRPQSSVTARVRPAELRPVEFCSPSPVDDDVPAPAAADRSEVAMRGHRRPFETAS